MENRSKFWDTYGKFFIALAIVLSATSLVMNLLSRRLETEAEPEPTASGEFWIGKEETNVINVLSAGAVMPCSDIQPDHVFASLDSLVKNYDVAAVSMHSLIGSNTTRSFGEELIEQGYGMYGLAYPDALAFGKDGIDKSMAFWDAQRVRTSGTHTSTDTSNLIRMSEYNGISVIYLSYTDVLNGTLPENENYLVNVYNDEKTPLFVNEAANMADLVIVSITWAGEPGALPNERQRTIAEALAGAGASIICGYSEHAVQPACWIDDTLVFYSLGDLYSEEDDVTGRIGALGAVTVTETIYGDKSRVELINPKVDLVVSVPAKEGHSDVKLLKDADDTEVPDHKQLYEGYTQTLQRMDDSIRIGGLN